MKLLVGLLMLAASNVALGANILALLPMPSRSHGILMERLLRELSGRGHSITYITTSLQTKQPMPNMTLIHVPNAHEAIMKNAPDAGNMFNLRHMSPWGMFFFSFAGIVLTDHIMQDEHVQKVIQSNEKFDLILGETFLDESILAGFAQKFDAPIVGIMSFMPSIWANYLTGTPTPSSYIPDPNLGYGTRMTFLQRIHNFLYTLAWELYHPTIYLNMQDKVMRQYFDQNFPPIQDILLSRTSLVLVNHHHSLAFPRPYTPNMIEIGGMHINPPKALSKDLQKYMDEAKEGVVLFSMGSNLNSKDMSPEIIQAILRGFARLPYKVLWKFEADLDSLPKNVRIEKWLPQNDILAHPNLKLFITHGGLLSTTEAVHRGVPVVGIPIFGDQPLNMKQTENAGFGLTLHYDSLTEDKLYESIMEVATNPKYSQAAKLKSAVLQDRISSPIDTAVWWIEYIIRHNGAYHLRSAVIDLAFYERYQLDVIAVLILSLYISYKIVSCSLCCLYRLVCKRSQSNAQIENKQKKKTKKNN